MARVSGISGLSVFCLLMLSNFVRYVEWEDNPERKRIATQILKTKKFTPIPGASAAPAPMPYDALR